MRELNINHVDNSTLIVSHPDGEEFRVVVDSASLAQLRGIRSSADGIRVSPKDVQTHIRSGLSAKEVAALTGASLDFISRFEGPVLAEREFIINSALAIETHATVELETGESSRAFGALIHSRLRDLGAAGERWASWKEPDGSWVVKLEFVASDIDHDARWGFEPRKRSLAPLNSDAATLSQKGDLSSGIIPRLRAVSETDINAAGTSLASAEAARENDAAVASSTASMRDGLATVSHLEFATASEEFTYETNIFVGLADLTESDTPESRPQNNGDAGTSPTADLLEALRRRRGESDAKPAWLLDELAVNTVTEASDSEDTLPQPLFTEPATREGVQRTGSHARRERASMPSWDEIVFGTRSEDDAQ
jgi:hypothetical protein